MSTHEHKASLNGDPLSISGTVLSVGDQLPLVRVTNSDMQDVSLEQYLGKTLVVSIVPSIDTPVCQVQTRNFNEAIASLGEGVQVLTISRDLPFAQKRWCGAEGIESVECVSDFKHKDIGKAFGVELDDLGILARAVFVVDAGGVIKHAEYVSEISEEPDYDSALKAVKQ